MKRKIRNLPVLLLAWLAVFILMGSMDTDVAYAAATGYTDHAHTWSAHEECGGCKEKKGYADCATCSHTGKVKCTTCEGKGYNAILKSAWDDGGATYEAYMLFGCGKCGGDIATSASVTIEASEDLDAIAAKKVTCGSGKINCSKCGGDGSLSTKCTRCNGTGENYKCTNPQCTLVNTDYKSSSTYKYNNWASELAGNANGTGWYDNTMHTVCYTTENKYTIAFNANGGSGSTANLTGCYYDNTYTLTANGYTRTGYTFTGWNTKANGTGTAYANRASVSKLSATDGAKVTLYAQWKANTYTVTYNANGGTGAPASQNFVFGSSTALSTTVPSRTGYTFVNWKATHTNSYFNPGDAIPSGWGSFTLAAQWKANTYTVTFNPCGGSVSETGRKVTYDSAYGTFPTPGRAGYTFNGWYTKPTGGSRVLGTDTVKTVSDLTLYAQWTRNEYTVTYHGNGGTPSTGSADRYYGETVDLSVTAEKPGYIFVGWNTSPNASEGLSSLTMPEGNVDLYAIYSIPVSDVKDVYLKIWPKGNPDNYRIYYLGKTDTQHMKYTYEIDSSGAAAFLGGAEPDYAIIVSDNAGNSSALAGADEEEKFVQTVEHYMRVNGAWIKFDTVTEERYKGETYAPAYVTPPDGYRASAIDPEYVVEGAKVSKAYYEAEEYVLTFDANGGTCDVKDKKICYGDVYGELPTPVRKGYTFLGWYTEKETGTLIKSESRYLTLGDSKVYAHWEVNKYQVIYDYRTNGGTSASMESAYAAYGSYVDLSVSAQKEGWTFMGWNTDPDATGGLSSLKMGNRDVVLYAIFKKDIRVSFIFRTDGGTKTSDAVMTIYNRETQAVVPVPEPGAWTGWTSPGWSLSRLPEGTISASAGGFYTCKENLTFYAVYQREITLSYDTNGSSMVLKPQSGVRLYNASGTYRNPSFVVADAPFLADSSFVSWMDMENQTAYTPGIRTEITKDTLLTAKWDMYPEITAYNRYFTLEEARNGVITESELLSTVTGTDKEDGILENGTAVVVENFAEGIFTGLTDDAEVAITYKATDSFGHTVTKTVTIHVVDTAVKADNRVSYYRFISARFYKDGEGNLLPAAKGGLEETSVWRTNPAYRSLLDAALSNQKVNQITKTVSYLGVQKEVLIEGSGEWEHVEDTWYFTKEDLKKSQEFTESYVSIRGSITDYVEKFLEWFGGCKK